MPKNKIKGISVDAATNFQEVRLQNGQTLIGRDAFKDICVDYVWLNGERIEKNIWHDTGATAKRREAWKAGL